MHTFLFILRYRISSILIHIGLNVMPDSAYKRELLRRLWELRYDVEAAIDNYHKQMENTNGDQ